MSSAGNETTATAIGNLLFVLATQPEIAKTLRESVDDDRLMNRFVEELLRFAPPVRGLAKMTTCEVELGGTKLPRSEEHTSELQSLMRISYAVFCLKKKNYT